MKREHDGVGDTLHSTDKRLCGEGGGGQVEDPTSDTGIDDV